MEALIIAVTGNEAKIGRKLQKLVDKKDYDAIPNVFNKIKLPKGAQLGIAVYDDDPCQSIGGESRVTITLQDGTVIGDDDKNFWKLISCEDSSAGAWQMYLLYNLWHYLPLFWHANYERRWYIYSDDQLKKYNIYVEEDHGLPAENFNPDKYEIEPLIWEEDGVYHVSACYWSNFEGLVREELKISTGQKSHVYSRPVSHRALFRYHSGILY